MIATIRLIHPDESFETKATPHEIEGCKVIAHRHPRWPRLWGVTEPVSGYWVAEGSTRKEALENARTKILQYGVETFHQAVASARL